MSNVVTLSEQDAARAANIAANVIAQSKGATRGIRFEVMAILLANEVYDIAGITKSGGSMPEAEQLMDDMMAWLNERAMELHAEIATEGVEATTPN
jgi:hypothetical protein